MYKKVLFLSSLAIASFAFSGCSDDDDDANYAGSEAMISSTIFETESGEKYQLSSVGSRYSFSYDSKNRITKAQYYSDGFRFSYDPFKVSVIDDDSENVSMSFNGNGYVSSYSESYSDGSESTSGNAYFSYDSEGHLTQYSFVYTDKGEEDGEAYNESERGTVVLTWVDGNLTQVKETSTATDESGETETYETTTTYSYGSMSNKFKQFTYLMNADRALTEEMGIEILTMPGLLGKWSATLPTSIKTVSIENGNVTRSSSSTSTYSIKANGLISSEKNGSSTYNYSYRTPISNEETAEKTSQTTQDNSLQAPVRKRKHGIMGRIKR